MGVIIYSARRSLIEGTNTGDIVELPLEFKVATETRKAVRRITIAGNGNTQIVLDRVDTLMQLENTFSDVSHLPQLRQFIDSVFSHPFTLDTASAAVSTATLTPSARSVVLESDSVTLKRLGQSQAYRLALRVRDIS